MARVTQVAAIIGAVVAAKWGQSLGAAVQSTLVGAAGILAAVATHEHHSNGRAQLSASVQVGAHQVIADQVAAATHAAVSASLAPMAVAGQALVADAQQKMADLVTPAPDGATVQAG